MPKHFYIYTWIDGNLKAFYAEEVLRKIKQRYPKGSSLGKTTRLIEEEFGEFASCPLVAKSLPELYKKLENRGIIVITQKRPFGDKAPITEDWFEILLTKNLEGILDDKT